MRSVSWRSLGDMIFGYNSVNKNKECRKHQIVDNFKNRGLYTKSTGKESYGGSFHKLNKI